MVGVVVDELVVVVEVVLRVVLCVVVDELVVVGGTVTVDVVSAAAADRQSAGRQHGGERDAGPPHDSPSRAGWRRPQYGQSLTSRPISWSQRRQIAQVLRGPQKRGIRRRERQRLG